MSRSDPAHDPNALPELLVGANRPPSEGVECRLGSSIIKTASPKKNALPVEALKKPHVLSIYNPAFRAIQKQREHKRLVSLSPGLPYLVGGRRVAVLGSWIV